jgi:hypothetical protein
MRPLSISFGAGLVSLASAALAPALADPPATWTPDPTFPDYYQRDPAVMNGSCACAPVAAVDSFFWLASKYDLPNLTNGVTWQQLTNRLEGPRFMGTDFFGNRSAERSISSSPRSPPARTSRSSSYGSRTAATRATPPERSAATGSP